jgi:hypothetical protein
MSKKHLHQDNSVVIAKNVTLTFTQSLSDTDIKSEIIHFLDTLTRHLKNEGCKIIGHIKGKIDSAENGVLFFNQTAFDSLPDVKGQICNTVNQAEMVINIIVFGITKENVERAFNHSVLSITATF